MASIENRLGEDGKTTHRVKIRIKGARNISASFTRLTDAKKFIQSTEAAIREGRYSKTAESKKHTLNDLIDRYIEENLFSTTSNTPNTRRHLRYWKKIIGFHIIADITPAIIAQQRDLLLRQNTSRGTKRSPSTVIRYIAALSHAFTIAVNEWGWLDDNPIRKVTKPKATAGRVRFLSDDERGRLLEACKKSKSKFLYPIVVLAISTGMRHGELINLRWPDIDLTNGMVTLNKTKNGEIRSVPLTSHALEQIKLLSKVRRIDTDFLFPSTIVLKPLNIRKPWYSAIKKAKIDNFKFHDLRHCTASYLAMNGATLVEIADVLGHKTLSMVKRYAHISQPHSHQVVSTMNNKIFGDKYHA